MIVRGRSEIIGTHLRSSSKSSELYFFRWGSQVLAGEFMAFVGGAGQQPTCNN
jgi:hypothetical protein